MRSESRWRGKVESAGGGVNRWLSISVPSRCDCGCRFCGKFPGFGADSGADEAGKMLLYIYTMAKLCSRKISMYRFR